MVTGFWGPHSRQGGPLPSPRHGSKEAVVARRAPKPSKILEVRLSFEPSRVSAACVVQAYERVIPITRRPAPQARAVQQSEDAQHTQHVGGRQQL